MSRDASDRPGRPPTKIKANPPKGFERHDELMRSLDGRGWYRELAKRQRETALLDGPLNERYRERDDLSLEPIEDPEEMDRLMCRTEPVAECRDAYDLKIARRNGRLVIEIDVMAHDDFLIEEVKRLIKIRRGEQKPRRIYLNAWVNHRILALYDLKNMQYNLCKQRKQLAWWMFPEIKDDNARGDKYDRACELLDEALSSLSLLRHYPSE